MEQTTAAQVLGGIVGMTIGALLGAVIVQFATARVAGFRPRFGLAYIAALLGAGAAEILAEYPTSTGDCLKAPRPMRPDAGRVPIIPGVHLMSHFIAFRTCSLMSPTSLLATLDTTSLITQLRNRSPLSVKAPKLAVPSLESQNI